MYKPARNPRMVRLYRNTHLFHDPSSADSVLIRGGEYIVLVGWFNHLGCIFTSAGFGYAFIRERYEEV